MKAMCIDENKNFVWQDVPDLVCHDEFDVKIRIKACALNRADLMQRQGIYAPPEGWPLWPGLECAGDVVECPANGRFKVGDKVCALLGGGGYAEEVVVPEGMVMPMPKGFDYWEAAGIPEVYATAYLNLKIVGEIQKGETFFINGGEGGLGIATTQLAKHVFGCKVVAQVASDENGAFCKGVGADVVNNRFKDDLVKTLTDNPPNVAIDPVGGPLMGKCIATMPYRGRWISLASMAGPETVLDVNLLWRKNLRVIGSTLRSRKPEEKAAILAGLVKEVYPAFEARTFAPFVHKVMPIAEVTEAHAILERGENRGKVVLTVLRFSSVIVGISAVLALTLSAAEKKRDYSEAAPFAKPEKLPEAKVDDLSLRQWRFTAKGIDWELKRTFAGRDYVLRLAYPATGAKPSVEGGSLYLNEYNLRLPLDAWIPPAIGVKARAVSFAVRPERLAGGVRPEIQLRQAKCLAGDNFVKRTPLRLKGAKVGAWMSLTVPTELVPGNRLADIAFLFHGAATNAACELSVADVKILCTDGTAYEVVNANPPSFLEGMDPAELNRRSFRALPTRPLVQLGVGTWPVIVGRQDLARIGAWGRKYCPEFDVVLSMGGSPEPCLRDLHALLPDNVYLQYQKAQHGRAYPALFNALPQNARGESQNFAFNSTIATHPMIRRALDEQLAHVATLGFNNFQVYDYVWLYKGGLWGYDPACVAAYREDLFGCGEKLVLTDGQALSFADYYQTYHGIRPQPSDFGYADWSEFAPASEADYRADGPRGARRFELFAMLRNYEWQLQAQRWNDRAASYGGRSDYLLNGESWVNANDHLFLLKLKNTGIVSPEFFSQSPKLLESDYHKLGMFVREAKRRGKRFGMTVETSRGGGNSQPYWSPRTGFAVCYALAGIGLNSFEYDHVPVCSIWSPETYRRFRADVTDAYARATERNLLGDLRGYRRATLDMAARPDVTSVLVLVRRTVSRETDPVQWTATLDRLGYDYAVTDIAELPDVIDGARVIFAGEEAKRPGTRELLTGWQTKGGGRVLLGDPNVDGLAERLAKLGLPRKRSVGSGDSAITLRFTTKGGESAVLFDRKAVEAADRKTWYNEKWAPTFSKFIADPANYLYFDAQPNGSCRVALDVAANGTYRVYRYLADREETVNVTDGALALDNSGDLCEVYYFAPDTSAFRAYLEEVKADRALTADVFVHSK